MNNNQFNINEKKVLNIKIYEEDFNLLKICVMTTIQNLNKNINDTDIDEELRSRLQNRENDYKKLLSKLETCKLYNEN